MDGSVVTGLAWPWPGEWRIRPGSDTGPWAGGVQIVDLEAIAALVTPLRRMLLMVSYDVPALLVQVDSGEEWAQLDFETMEPARAEPGAGPTAPEWALRPVLALPLVPFRQPGTVGAGMGMSLPALGQPTDTGEPPYLFVSAGLESSDTSLGNRFFDEVEGLTADMLEQATGLLASASLTPAGGAGLLWMIDPDYWWSDPEAMRTSQHVREMESAAFSARDVVRDTLGSTGDPLANFLTEQVTLEATERPDPPVPWFGRRRPPTLKQLLKWVGPGPSKASRRADCFFTNLDEWLRERGQDGLLEDGELDELRDAPWFEVLATLVDRSILTPPELAFVATASLESSAVQAERIDSHTVDLTVMQQLTVRVTLMRDATGAPVVPDAPDADDPSIIEPIREFTWDFLTPPDPSVLPVFVIVAAPGVDILFPSSPAPVGWTKLIIRVQDVALVPAWGTAVDPTPLLAPYQIGPDLHAELVLPDQPPASPVTEVCPRPNGVSLFYPMYPDADGQQLIALDITLDDTAVLSGDERFAIDVSYYHDTRGGMVLPDPTAHVCVWATSGVTVQVITTLLTEFRDYRLETEVWRVSDFSDVPWFGVSLPFDTAALDHFGGFAEGWEPSWTSGDAPNEGPSFTRDLTAEIERVTVTAWFSMVMDVVVGSIPLVGDVVDIADFFHALGTGTDKWGHPVTNLDMVLLGGGALLPFVSGSMVKGMGNAIEGLPVPEARTSSPPRTGRRSGVAPASTALLGFDELVQRALRPLGLVPADAEELAQRASRWNGLSKADRDAVVADLVRFATDYADEFGEGVAGRFLVLDDLLDATGGGFRIPEVMREYGRWRADVLRNADPSKPLPDLSPEAFLAAPHTRRVRTVLQALLGSDIVGSSLKKTRRSAQASMSWKSTAGHVPHHIPPPRVTLDDHIATHGLASQVQEVVEARPPAHRLNGEPLWTDQEYLSVSPVVRGTSADYANRVERLLAFGLEAVLGPNKSFYPRELARLLVTALDLIEHDLQAAGRTLEDALPPGSVRRRIEGIQGFVRALVTGKGYEHGARYEVQMAAQELTDAMPATNVFIRIGALLPGIIANTLREGPDLLRYIGTNSTVADILQGKAYSSLTKLISTVTPAKYMKNGLWRGPEIFRQTISDIQRMANQIPPFMLESLDGTGQVRFSGLFEICIDRKYFLSSRAKPTTSLSPAYVARVASWKVSTIIERLSVDEIIEVLDHLKGVMEPEDLDELIEVGVLPAVREQIQAFLDDPGLAQTLGITIPPKMRFSIDVKFR